MNFATENQHASDIATQAGRLLLNLREKAMREGWEAQTLKETGDKTSHNFIIKALNEIYPNDAILSEEGSDDKTRLKSDRVWIVDPLDGTREFSELDRSDWAIHIALVIDSIPVVGAVAIPGRNLTLNTGTPPVLLPFSGNPLRIVVSRTRPPAIALSLAQELKAELVEMGSAGVKTMAVALGDADVFVHAGGQYEWDSAAPVAVATAAGLHTSRIDGSFLLYNQENPWLPDQLICRKEIALQVLGTIARVGNSSF